MLERCEALRCDAQESGKEVAKRQLAAAKRVAETLRGQI